MSVHTNARHATSDHDFASFGHATSRNGRNTPIAAAPTSIVHVVKDCEPMREMSGRPHTVYTPHVAAASRT